jgi:AcrR family transcriptional regulator
MDTKDRILEAAVGLLDEGGPEAMSTRAVSAAADVHVPEIYRLFGDKQGLLEDLRRGWDLHVEFGLSNPAVYAAVYGARRPGRQPPAVEQAEEHLRQMIRRVAQAGRLRIDEEQAANLVSAAGRGVTLALINTPEPERDLSCAQIAREAVMQAITTDASDGADPILVAALTLRSALPEVEPFTDSERALMIEWLDRLISTRG